MIEDENLVTMDEDELDYFLAKLEHSDNSFDEELKQHEEEVSEDYERSQ